MTPDDELEALASMSDEELDAEIRAAGADPVAIRERGAAVAEVLLAHEDAQYAARAKARVDAMKEQFADWPDVESLSRAELLERLRLSQIDPRFHDVLEVLLARHASDGLAGDHGATDAELRGILESVEVLRRLDRERGMGGARRTRRT